MQSARRDLGKLAAQVLSGADTGDAVVLAWPLVCGSAVAQRVKADSFQNGTLSVVVPDTAWRSQLEEFSRQYIEGLRHLTGAEVLRIQYLISGT